MEPYEPPSRLSVDCGQCRSPVVIDDLVWHIRFPDDEEAVVQLLQGRLNARRCPLCKALNRAPVQIVIQDTVTSRAPRFIVLLGSGLERTNFVGPLTTLGWSLEEAEKAVSCGDYGALQLAVLQWLATDMEELLLLLASGEIARRPPEFRQAQATRLRLRVLRMLADGVLWVALRLPEPLLREVREHMEVDDDAEALRLLWPRQVAGLVHTILREEVVEALRVGGLGDLTARCLRRVPAEVLDDLLVDLCLEDCMGLLEVEGDEGRFYRAYRDHFVNAIVHFGMGRPNPEGHRWAAFLSVAWDALRRQAFPDSLLPSREEAPALVLFEDLWHLRAPALARGTAQERSDAIDEIADIMDRFGLGHRLHSVLEAGAFRAVPPSDTDRSEAGRRLKSTMFELLTRRYALPLDPGRSEEYGAVGARLVNHLIGSGFSAAAAELAAELVHRAIDAGDYVAAFGAASGSLRYLSRAELWLAGFDVVQSLTDRFSDPDVVAQLGRADPHLSVDFWNESGNVLRALRRGSESLTAYRLARTFSAQLDEERRNRVESVIWANEARALRDMGRYQEAHDRLTALVDRSPGDPMALHSLALLYLETHDAPRARAVMDRAVGAHGTGEPRSRARLLLTRGMSAARDGDPAAALADFEEALALAPPDAELLVTQVSAAVAAHAEGLGEHPAVRRAEARLIDVLEGRVLHGAVGIGQSVRATALAALGGLVLGRAQPEEIEAFVNERMDPFLAEPATGELPWQLWALRARLSTRVDAQESRWPWFRRALERLDEAEPEGPDAAFMLGWLGDREAFQLEVGEAVIHLSRAGTVDPTELLSVFEFANGRSTSPRLAEDSFHAIAQRAMRALDDGASVPRRRIRVIAFLEGTDTVQPFVLGAGAAEPVLLPPMPFGRAALARVQAEYAAALSHANPFDLASLDRQLASWQAVAEWIGAALAPWLAEGDHLVVMPGRSLNGLPLHLCPLGPSGALVIDAHPVTYAPSFSVLARQPAEPPGEVTRPLVVAVAKSGDGESLREALESAGDRLGGAGPPAVVLKGAEATHARVKECLAASDEAYFLCHGAHGGGLAGFSICISDGVSLPPSPLIDEVPELERFTLDWTDLADLDRAPWLIVSIACSPGRTLVVEGGSRLGLEQTMFAHGTRALLSPQWDVDQEAAIHWVEAFHRARREDGKGSPAEWCRAAAMATRPHFPHPFFWGAFVHTGGVT